METRKIYVTNRSKHHRRPLLMTQAQAVQRFGKTGFKQWNSESYTDGLHSKSCSAALPVETDSDAEDSDGEIPEQRHASAEAWTSMVNRTTGFDSKIMLSWKSDMDNVLVFVTIVTAFLIVSTDWLSNDTSDLLLNQISTQLSLGLNLQSQESLLSPPSHSQIVINVLWFASLILSLNTAVMAILVKQWIAEYLWDVTSLPSSSRNSLAVRQLRYEALSRWRLPEITGFIPVQLLTAVVLFLAGLVYYTLTFGTAVAVVPWLLTGLCFLFLIFTSILPTIFPDCAYQSPQSWILHQLLRLGESGPPALGWSDLLLQISKSVDGTAYISRALCWFSTAFNSSDASSFGTAWLCACELEAPFASRTLCQLFDQFTSTSGRATLISQNVTEKNYIKGYQVLLDGFPLIPSTDDDITRVLVIAEMFRKNPCAKDPAVGIFIKTLATNIADMSSEERLLVQFRLLKSLVLLNKPPRRYDDDDLDVPVEQGDKFWMEAFQTVLGIAQETARNIQLASLSQTAYPPASNEQTYTESVFVLSAAVTMGFASRLSTRQISPHLDAIRQLLEAMTLYLRAGNSTSGSAAQKLKAIGLWSQSLKCGIALSPELELPGSIEILQGFLQSLLDYNDWGNEKRSQVLFHLVVLRGTSKMIVDACASRARSTIDANGAIRTLGDTWLPSRVYRRGTTPIQEPRDQLHLVLGDFLSTTSWDLAPLDTTESLVDYLALIVCWLHMSPNHQNRHRTSPINASEAAVIMHLVKVLSAMESSDRVTKLVSPDLLRASTLEILRAINSEFEDVDGDSDVIQYRSLLTDDVKPHLVASTESLIQYCISSLGSAGLEREMLKCCGTALFLAQCTDISPKSLLVAMTDFLRNIPGPLSKTEALQSIARWLDQIGTRVHEGEGSEATRLQFLQAMQDTHDLWALNISYLDKIEELRSPPGTKVTRGYSRSRYRP